MQSTTVMSRPTATPPAAPPPPAGRLRRWRSSWLLALRMSRREVRRNKGRAALAFVMILFPALIMCLSVTLIASGQATGARQIPYVLGDAQAKLDHLGGPVTQAPDPGTVGESASIQIDEVGNPLKPTKANPTKARGITGGELTPFTETFVKYSVGQLRKRDTVWRFDPQKLTGRAILRSGRWPNDPGEAVVTDYGVTRGLPTSGTVTVTESSQDGATGDGPEETLTIVGTASARALGQLPAIITPNDAKSGDGTDTLFVTGADPVTWDKVVALNKLGYSVVSAAVLADPPPEEVWNQSGEYSGSQRTLAWALALGAPFMAIVIGLLVAPAFAVSAARSRRTLALAASNGATTADLRRTVLGRALVIGVGAALLGASLGVAAVLVIFQVTERQSGYMVSPEPDVPWLVVAAVVVVAVASAVAAALVPASRLGRLDIVSVMRGQAASSRPNLILAVLGVVGVAVSSALLFRVARGGGVGALTGDLALSVGSVGMILGGVLLVPTLLAAVARMGGSFPMSGRVAARDMGRHRSRSAPTVAAVLAGAAALTLGLTGMSSDAEQEEREYQYSAMPGEGYANISTDNAAKDADRLAAAHPELDFTRVRSFDFAGAVDPESGEGASGTPIERRWFTVVPSGCTPEQTVRNPEYLKKLAAYPTEDPDKKNPPPEDPCAQYGVGGSGSSNYGRYGVLMMPADWLIDRLRLNDEQASTLRKGGVILAPQAGAERPPATAKLASGTYTLTPAPETDSGDAGEDTYSVRVTREWDAPTIPVTTSARRSGELLNYSMAVASDGPSATSIPSTTGSNEVFILFRNKDGAELSDAVAERLTAEGGEEFEVNIERGVQSYTLVVTAIVLSLFTFLLLIVVLTSTALTLAEQQRDQATLAAIGATARTRRVMAGTQAFLIAGIGSIVGVLLGLLPGAAAARRVTEPQDSISFSANGVAVPETGAILVFPWLTLLAVAVVIPLIAGTLAAVAIRRAPAITRRPS